MPSREQIVQWLKSAQLIIGIIIGFLGATSVTAVSSCRPAPTPPTKPGPPLPPDVGQLDPWNAIGKIAMPGSYCSGTVVGPRSGDGRWTIVSAAHCVRQVGDRHTFISRGGKSTGITVVGIDRRSDISIYHTDPGQGGMAYATVAESTPPVGTKVFHGGFGRDRPSNREEGVVEAGPNGQGQVQYHLSVSPGDSGGGICMTVKGELLSPVCCTTRLDGPGTVFGGSPERIRAIILTPTEFTDLPPHPMPPAPQPMPAKK